LAMYSGFTRVTSVSSMRSTNVPRLARANAQSYRAVRMLPTCRSPLGEGANRTRIPRSVTFLHLVRQGADTVDRHRYLAPARSSVAGTAGSPGSPRQEPVPRRKLHHTTRGGDTRRHALAGPRDAGVPHPTVHRRDQRDVPRHGVGLDPRPQRAERVEPLRP